jgi:hypothetical protein
MNCQQVQIRLSAFLDGFVVEEERYAVERHLVRCTGCATARDQYSDLRMSLHSLPVRAVTPELSSTLRVMASRAAARRRRFAGMLGWVQERFELLKLRSSLLLRPLAVPAFGGLCSAIFLFTLVMTHFRGIVIAQPNDIPTALTTNAELISSPSLNIDSDYVVVDVLVDEQGRLLDYRFPEGYGSLKSKDANQRLEHALRYSVFLPATSFGQPVQGWVRVYYSTQRNEMDVKG